MREPAQPSVFWQTWAAEWARRFCRSCRCLPEVVGSEGGRRSGRRSGRWPASMADERPSGGGRETVAGRAWECTLVGVRPVKVTWRLGLLRFIILLLSSIKILSENKLAVDEEIHLVDIKKLYTFCAKYLCWKQLIIKIIFNI